MKLIGMISITFHSLRLIPFGYSLIGILFWLDYFIPTIYYKISYLRRNENFQTQKIRTTFLSNRNEPFEVEAYWDISTSVKQTPSRNHFLFRQQLNGKVYSNDGRRLRYSQVK